MGEASSSPQSWPVKFRLINRDTVLPSQTLLFMSDRTLRERKLEAYVLIKILKYCTGSSARSYQCKFAMEIAFSNKNIEILTEIGTALKIILHHKTLRRKFSSVHPDLAAEGINRVGVNADGLFFSSGKNKNIAKGTTDPRVEFILPK